MSRPLRLAVGYFHPWPNDAGFLLAAADGAELTVSAADPLRGDALQAVCDEAADVAVVPTNRLLVRRERGQDVVALAAVNHVALETIQTLASTGVRRPADLAGRTIALNPTPRGLAMVRHLVEADGGDPDAVRVLDSGVRELDVAGIPGGAYDATFGGYWAWDVLLAHPPAGDEHVVWPIGELGAPAFQPYVLAATRAMLGRQAERLDALLDAAAAGFHAAAADPERALEVLERVVPYFPSPVLRRSLELIAPTWFAPGGGWGAVDPALLEGYASWLAGRGVLQHGGQWRAALRS